MDLERIPGAQDTILKYEYDDDYYYYNHYYHFFHRVRLSFQVSYLQGKYIPPFYRDNDLASTTFCFHITF